MGGIQVHKCYLAMHSSTCNGVEPEYMNWRGRDIKLYLKSHPMPDDPTYSKEDMINDLTNTGGVLTFPIDIKPETIEFLELLMNWLSYDLPKTKECEISEKEMSELWKRYQLFGSE